MPTGLQVWSETPATNATADSNVNWAEGQAPSSVNDSARAMMASIAKWRDDNNGTLVTSGSSTAFTLATNQVETALTNGYVVRTQLHTTPEINATLNVDGLGAKPIQLFNGTAQTTNYEFQGGSIQGFTYLSSGTGQWVTSGYINPRVPTALTTTSTSLLTFITNSLSGDVNLNNTALFFDGPTVSQGSSGTWFVTGSVAMTDASAGAFFEAKLWDGTTIVDSGVATGHAATAIQTVSLSGVIASPAGNLKISCKDVTTANGAIRFNYTGSSKDSTVTAIRIG